MSSETNGGKGTENPQGNPSPAEMRVPILPGTAASDYERYLRTEELLALQKPAAAMAHEDELLFQVVHQSSELLLKGAAWELERVSQHIADGDAAQASRLMRRAIAMLEHPIEMLRLLETISPYDYHLIRAGLGHGSGLDSPGFLGLLHAGPQLGAAFQRLMAERGLKLQEMYRSWREHFELHELAEALLDFDERVQVFREHHLRLARRIIGGGVFGTSGNPVEVLERRKEHIFYKDLWDVRNEITEECNERIRKQQARSL
jgi:tryptophan 2,3-dioxygenase